MPTRRDFTRSLAAGALSFPMIVSAKKTDSVAVVGEGAHRYEVQHDFLKLPDKYRWQTTHNVAVDKQGQIYVIHEGQGNQKDHPSIFVFDAAGMFVRAFGSEFQGGGHGLEIREEDGSEYLYVTAYQALKTFAKLTLTGERVWKQYAPMASGFYADGEDSKPTRAWGRNRFMPTNIAFHPVDGGFYMADGYGAHTVHCYNAAGEWQSAFGKSGKKDGEFNLPHGLWIDTRGGREASVVVADRANARLQWFKLDGSHIKTLGGFILPANVDQYGDLLLVPDLSARITLLDANDQLIHLAEDGDWRKQVLANGKKLRREPDRWAAGKFVHPHDACFDADGNIIVAEWVSTGRVSRLRKL
ncbi:MAG: hypothetical protein ACI8W8_001080 [Rhodothermales bacterium]|jgi:hypothetical protein